MKNRYLKRLLILFISCSLISSSVLGGYYGPTFRNSNFDESLLLYDLELNNISDNLPEPALSNIEEWALFFEGKYDAKSLNSVIYRNEAFKGTHDELKKLQSYSILDINLLEKEEAFIHYLELALHIEEHLKGLNHNPWKIKQDKSIHVREFEVLSQRCHAMIDQSSYKFIIERLAYQLIKLNRYHGNYDEVERLYKLHFKNVSSFISYWAMDQYAGAIRKLGRKAESNYLFSKVYTYSPSRRGSAMLSIDINSALDMQSAIALCRNDEEKIALYFVRGMNSANLADGEIQSIYEILGDHPLSRQLMIKAILKVENHYLEFDKGKRKFNHVSSSVENYANRLIQLNHQFIDGDNAHPFWRLSLSYLYWLKGEDDKSIKSLGDAPSQPGLLKQHQIIELLNLLGDNKDLSINEENRIGSLLYAVNDNLATISPVFLDERERNTSYKNNFNLYIFRAIRSNPNFQNDYQRLIFNGKRIEKDLLRRKEQDELQLAYTSIHDEQLTVEYIQKLLSLRNKNTKSKLIEYAEQCYFRSYVNRIWPDASGDKFDKAIDYVLKEIEATLWMRNPDNLDKAISIFQSIPVDFQFPCSGNPFEFRVEEPNIHLDNFPFNDYSYPDSTLPEKYSKLELAEKLNRLYNSKKPNGRGKDLFQVALAYYNMSLSGNAWKYLSYFRYADERSGILHWAMIDEITREALEDNSLTDEERAMAHYLGARCQKKIYKSSDKATFFNFRKDFNQLISEYSHTEFYQSVVKECADFRLYVNK